MAVSFISVGEENKNRVNKILLHFEIIEFHYKRFFIL
jgi:hypothetical protein